MSAGSSRTAAIAIGNKIAEMARIADFVERFGADHAIPQRVIDNLNVCLDELINNTISYGYRDQEAHEIEIELMLVGDAVVAEIRDDGAPFDPRQAAPAALDGRIGGLGLHFVKSLMDELDYVRVGRHNVVKITKRLRDEKTG